MNGVEETMNDQDYPWHPEWIEGHDSGSCFWIMPVRRKESAVGFSKCDCREEDQLSIEEDTVYKYLFSLFLERHFDKDIQRPFKYQEFDEESFGWHDNNIYNYQSVRKIVVEMKSSSKDFPQGSAESMFYATLADRLALMIQRNPDWEFITFEGP